MDLKDNGWWYKELDKRREREEMYQIAKVSYEKLEEERPLELEENQIEELERRLSIYEYSVFMTNILREKLVVEQEKQKQEEERKFREVVRGTYRKLEEERPLELEANQDEEISRRLHIYADDDSDDKRLTMLREVMMEEQERRNQEERGKLKEEVREVYLKLEREYPLKLDVHPRGEINYRLHIYDDDDNDEKIILQREVMVEEQERQKEEETNALWEIVKETYQKLDEAHPMGKPDYDWREWSNRTKVFNLTLDERCTLHWTEVILADRKASMMRDLVHEKIKEANDEYEMRNQRKWEERERVKKEEMRKREEKLQEARMKVREAEVEAEEAAAYEVMMKKEAASEAKRRAANAEKRGVRALAKVWREGQTRVRRKAAVKKRQEALKEERKKVANAKKEETKRRREAAKEVKREVANAKKEATKRRKEAAKEAREAAKVAKAAAKEVREAAKVAKAAAKAVKEAAKEAKRKVVNVEEEREKGEGDGEEGK